MSTITRGSCHPTRVLTYDTGNASLALARSILGYFTAKSLHDGDACMRYFHRTQAVYVDATVGLKLSQLNITTALRPVVATWPEDAKSYPLWITGDLNSAVVLFVDTPTLFGEELRLIAAFDFKGGKVTLQIDYWDGRRNSVMDL
ncbi:hypothetical protein IFR05_006999 [Cadophora sp. M221]|nr:hypothetical protein IFR05_006999 [Cadophora sp. M221]